MVRLLCFVVAMVISLSLSAAAEPALKLNGSFSQGGMIWGSAPPGTELTLDGEAVPVAENGLFVFGFGRDASPSATLRICRAQQCQSRELSVAQRQYDIQRIEGVPQETVTPPAAVVERIRSEAKLVRAARATVSARQDFATPFVWPARGKITGVFGSQRVYNGQPRRPHYGVDVAGPVGAPVVAPAAGKVTLVHEGMFYSGGTLVIDHGQGISSTFIHLSKIHAREGQDVAQGELIAEIGATGRATGPHLDWRMNWFNVRLDPAMVVGPMPAE